MRQAKPPYDMAIRHRIVTLARGGVDLRTLAKEFGCTERSIRTWKRQVEMDEGPPHDKLTVAEKKELSRLRRENQQLREERDILKKASAWFAREAARAPRRVSNS